MIYSKLNFNYVKNKLFVLPKNFSTLYLKRQSRQCYYSSSISNNFFLDENKNNLFYKNDFNSKRFLSEGKNCNNLVVCKNVNKSSKNFFSSNKTEFKKINLKGDLNLVKTDSVIEILVPSYYHPYIDLMRLNRLTGTWLLLYPCLWSICLAGQFGHYPDFKMMGLFTLGAIMMRSAGCIVNDMIDKDIDKKVDRTKSRPLASGKLSNLEAFAALTTLLTGSLHVLLSFDILTIIYGASSLLLVASYPFMKRLTNLPQLFLGLTFNWGAILGWSAMQNGMIDWKIVLPLYASGIFWTLIYDTIYGYQDYNSDKKIGLKSSTMLLGENPKPWLNSFNAAMATSLLLTGIISDQLWPYYLGIGGSAFHLSRIIKDLNIKDTNNCFKNFRNCQFVGYYILIGIILSTLFKDKKSNINVNTNNLKEQKVLI